MSLAKNVLHRLGLLGAVSQARNGTWKYLRGGYSPKRFWDGWGEGFSRQKYQQEIHAGQAWLLSKLSACGGMSMLEVGCGFGRNLEYLSRNLGATVEAADAAGAAISAHAASKIDTLPGHMFGVDISAALLRRSRAALPKDCGLAAADILSLPFADGGFDVVFTHGVLMHVPPADLRRALAEIRRVAGREALFVEETYWDGLRRSGEVSINGYTFLHDYRSALAEAGFGILEAAETGGSVNLALYRCRS